MLNKIHRLGYAVADLQAAARFYEKNFDASPSEPEKVEDQGIVAAMFRVGGSSIELMQPTQPNSPVGKFLAKRAEGFHHVAYQAADIDASLAELKGTGVRLIDEMPRIGAGGTLTAFVHPKGAFGVLTELVEVPREGKDKLWT